MTKRYKILQRKLQELDAKLNLVLSAPAETTPLNERIQQRFAFLKNLLSAEIASRPSKPKHLHHISKRITELEISFRDHINYENSLDCSCGESSLDDDGEAALAAASSDELDSLSENDDHEHQLPLQRNDGESPRALVKLKVQRDNDDVDFISSGSDQEVEENSVKNVELGFSDEQEVHVKSRSPARLKTAATAENEDYYDVKKKEGRISVLGKYCGALMAGTVLGMIIMGAAAVVMVGNIDSLCFPSLQKESFIYYT